MNLLEFYPNILEKTIPLNLLDISSRNYLNWKKEQLLYVTTIDKSEHADFKRKWVQLNLFDALWLLIIKELRNFNTDFNTIRTIKEIMYSNVELNQEKIDATLEKDFLNSILKYIPEMYQEVMKPLLIDGSVFSFLNKIIDEKNVILFTNIGIIFFDILIKDAFVSLFIRKNKDSVDVFILKNDKDIYHIDNIENNKIISNYILNDAFINIPIIPLIGKLFENSDFDKYNLHYAIFNQNERKIIEALNNDLCKEIKITKHQSGDLTLSLTFEENVKNDNAKEIRKILGLKQYEKIEMIYRNDKHLIINKTIKEILKKE